MLSSTVDSELSDECRDILELRHKPIFKKWSKFQNISCWRNPVLDATSSAYAQMWNECSLAYKILNRSMRMYELDWCVGVLEIWLITLLSKLQWILRYFEIIPWKCDHFISLNPALHFCWKQTNILSSGISYYNCGAQVLNVLAWKMYDRSNNVFKNFILAN